MTTTRTPHLYVGRERPGLTVWALDTIDEVLDLTAYGSWTVVLEQDGVETTLTGCTVTPNANPTADTHGPADIGTLTLSFAAGSLDDIKAGPGTLKIVGVLLGRDREFQAQILVGD